MLCFGAQVDYCAHMVGRGEGRAFGRGGEVWLTGPKEEEGFEDAVDGSIGIGKGRKKRQERDLSWQNWIEVKKNADVRNGSERIDSFADIAKVED